MDLAATWKHCFTNWPADIERRGVIVTTYDEQIAFEGFMTNDSMLMIERRAPDTLGARKVVLPYEKIEALKFTDVIKNRSLQSLGFVDTRPRKPAPVGA